MRRAFATAFVVIIFVSSYCFALTPVTVVKGPPASLEMAVHDFGVHEIYLTRPARPPSYVPSPVLVTLSRGSYPKIFKVDLAYKELPDGRIYFRVDIPKEDEPDYEIRAIELTPGGIWYELFSGKLNVIPPIK